MPNNDEKDSLFPPEYAHLDKMVREAQEQIRLIDEQIKNVPSDRGTAPQYNPPGFLRSRQMGSRDQRINDLEKQKGQVRAEVMDKVEKETINADPKTANTVRDKALAEMYSNPFEGKSAAEIKAARGEIKDLETAQNFAATLHKGDFRINQPDRDVAEPTNAPTNNEDKKSSPGSNRFSESLSYTKAIEKNDTAPDKSPNLEKGKEEIDKD
ncbi:hypothetical protein AHMF7605_25605 [Adhaeribacter arboris]|uniref:Uncharacterized protein n=1 Tax=Adhaeribacter arboris TaxID=2072846 RepID=A0A2T2YM91_9BACT|nr:hypothetical protein [Adhaeribacter arboris]PSR56628.1 hypothetical protein AHMF7605_25605 [Adhaeribacter arboris]